ncbi:hypothetical protein GCM10011511_00950 [Puia dinghuensis]|uniref:Uncharacterized protein n=2 Tax=Puia dinghuensis TaxID=1792502 RepID=A0A8J2XPM9_9BACT|nr:hypothetical protein GCM10011511_00950 [Puia dinghuensis]
MPQGLVLSEVIGAGQVSVKDSGKDLRDIGAVAGILLRPCLLPFLLCGPLLAVNGCRNGGSHVSGPQGFAGDGGASQVIDEDLVVEFLLAAGRSQ